MPKEVTRIYKCSSLRLFYSHTSTISIGKSVLLIWYQNGQGKADSCYSITVYCKNIIVALKCLKIQKQLP